MKRRETTLQSHSVRWLQMSATCLRAVTRTSEAYKAVDGPYIERWEGALEANSNGLLLAECGR